MSLIRERMEEHFELDQGPTRDKPMSCYPDNRFDVCLYFVDSYDSMDFHVQNMVQLSKLLPVVPLLAKVMTRSLSRSYLWLHFCIALMLLATSLYRTLTSSYVCVPILPQTVSVYGTITSRVQTCLALLPLATPWYHTVTSVYIVVPLLPVEPSLYPNLTPGYVVYRYCDHWPV
jgi:hypothetical protein